MMQMNRKFLFTVDQLELIRRLRNSGLTKEQVLCAFDSFECLDGPVSTSLNVPMTLQALQMQALQRLALSVPGAIGIGNGLILQQDNRLQQMQQLPQQQQQQQMQQLPQQQQQQPLLQQKQQQLIQLQQQLLQKLAAQQNRPETGLTNLTASNQPQQSNGALLKSVSDSGSVTDNSNNSEDIASNCGKVLELNEEGEIDTEELREFMSQGDVACLEEIKDFIVKHNIKQQQIAVLAGVSQPYVSRYLRGEFNSMSDRSCRAIKKWYLAYRKNPMSISIAANSALMMNGSNVGGGAPPPTLKKLMTQASMEHAGVTSSPPAGNDLEMLSCPRRERFVFRPNHLQVLERFFAEDNYPSYDKREEIALTCNKSTEQLVGRELTDREKVTVQIVSNWFANKRKDLKKLYKEEGLDASQVPLRSRGRPSYTYLDTSSLMLLQSVIDHQSSNATPPAPTDGAAVVEQPASETDTMASDVKTDAESNEASVDEAMALQYSVEMAAVNQAIISLTGQKPITIKTEKGDISEYLVTGQSRLNAHAPCVTADMS